MAKAWGRVSTKTETTKSLDEHLAHCVKHVSKDYICYRRDWLYEHLDEEFALLKRCKEMKMPSQGEVEHLLNECKEIGNNG